MFEIMNSLISASVLLGHGLDYMTIFGTPTCFLYELPTVHLNTTTKEHLI